MLELAATEEAASVNFTADNSGKADALSRAMAGMQEQLEGRSLQAGSREDGSTSLVNKDIQAVVDYGEVNDYTPGLEVSPGALVQIDSGEGFDRDERYRSNLEVPVT